MTETTTQAPAVYVPGKYEAEALRFMNDWVPSSRVPSQHIVAQQIGSNMFAAFAWSSRRKVWRPWDAGPQNAPRRVMVDAMLTQIEFANLTIMDEPVDFADYDGFTPAEFDHCAFCVPHIMICPTGGPGDSTGWAYVEMEREGVGRPLASSQAGLTGSFFHRQILAKEFRQKALPVENAPLGYARALRVAPVLLRHDRVAREVVPKEGWGIHGRPDLLARQMDREAAINAAFQAERERRAKAGEYQPPDVELTLEVSLRVDRELGKAA